MKTTNFNDLLAESLKDETVKKEYDALEEEFEVSKKNYPPPHKCRYDSKRTCAPGTYLTSRYIPFGIRNV